jgi:hypothetical protein
MQLVRWYHHLVQVGKEELCYIIIRRLVKKVAVCCEHATSYFMNTHGKGSLNSPIIISDDDDDVLLILHQQHLQRNDSSSSITSGIPFSDSQCDTTRLERNTFSKGRELLIGMGYRPGHGLGMQLDGKRLSFCEVYNIGLRRFSKDKSNLWWFL